MTHPKSSATLKPFPGSQEEKSANWAKVLQLFPNDAAAVAFARKNTDFRDRIAALTLQLEASRRSKDELVEVALKIFELSQSLAERWLIADYSMKRRFLEVVFLNFRLDGATLVYEMKKSFDVLAKELFV